MLEAILDQLQILILNLLSLGFGLRIRERLGFDTVISLNAGGVRIAVNLHDFLDSVEAAKAGWHQGCGIG